MTIKQTPNFISPPAHKELFKKSCVEKKKLFAEFTVGLNPHTEIDDRSEIDNQAETDNQTEADDQLGDDNQTEANYQPEADGQPKIEDQTEEGDK